MLSIIIPVYKTESTLDRCMESIVRQEYQDWEAILVDDGSPDGCPAICDEWGRRDPRISVVHQKNGGLSAARNAGLERVRGEYITFVDSDDYLSPDVLQKLMLHLSAHPDYDILEYSMLRFDDHGEQPFLSLEEQVYDDGQAYWLGERAYLHTYACNKIFRKSGDRDRRDIQKYPDGFVNVDEAYDDVHHVARYSFTQCPNAVFAKEHGLLHVLPLLCNSDYYGISQLHGSLIRCGTCGISPVCDYCVVGDRNIMAKEYVVTEDEMGFLVSRKKIQD